LYVPFSGWINLPLLCQVLIENERITLRTDRKVNTLFFDGQWDVDGLKTPVLILANGPNVNSFKETQHLPVTSVYGQMTAIKPTKESKNLLIPLCGEGHILPEINGLHHLGATYYQSILESDKYNHDEVNLLKLKQMGNQEIWSKKAVAHWSGTRATTPDYLPLVGQIPKSDEFITRFLKLETDSKRWIPSAGPYYQGLYMCAGFGSRGLTTVPLCAEWLASFINHEITCLPRDLIKALSPSRFLRRTLIRGVD
jgi:tRNA 5-methylaminomethyl-2-thiouridine biosynthesis bifunctional protein